MARLYLLRSFLYFVLVWHYRFDQQNSLRMLKEWKGMLGVVVSMLLILGAFSLTPAKRVGQMVQKMQKQTQI